VIQGSIITHEFPGGTRLHMGHCEVLRESVTAGIVLASQCPDGPPKGYERVTLRWVETETHDGGSRVDFEIVDRPIGGIDVESTAPQLAEPELVWQVPKKVAGKRCESDNLGGVT
jgi:hypothetical protein